MKGLADTNLVIAALQDADPLHARAIAHLREQGRLVVPLSVGIELLLGARAKSSVCVDVIAACDAWFDVESRDVLLTAARALDQGMVKTVFDAVHLADALHRQVPLHTADAALQRTPFPTTPF